MQAQIAWDKFLKTGAPQDYIKYCKLCTYGERNAASKN